MSVEASLPISLASSASPFSPSRTVNVVEPSTTCSFVTMWPWASRRKPEPLPPPLPLASAARMNATPGLACA
jgi:hypothetical protein